MRILIAEDEPDLIRTLSQAMREEGHAVDEAIDGTEALHKATEWDYDAIVLNELAARVRALIRRAQGAASALIEIGDVAIDTSARRVTKAGQAVTITGREYALLEFLGLRRGKIVTRTDLYEHLHDENDTPISNLVDVHVSNLRKKLGADFIATHRGQGYCIGS